MKKLTGGEPFFHAPLSTIYKMSVHIHLSVADLFKMATVSAADATAAANADGVAAAAASDAAAAARLAQETRHQEELKELRAEMAELKKMLKK